MKNILKIMLFIAQSPFIFIALSSGPKYTRLDFTLKMSPGQFPHRSKIQIMTQEVPKFMVLWFYSENKE